MRAYTLVFSIVAHIVGLAAIVVAPLFAVDALPDPHKRISIVELPMPLAPPPAAPRARQTLRKAEDWKAAPLEAPDGVKPETTPPPIDLPGAGGPPVDGVVPGAEGGAGNLLLPPAPPPPPPVPRSTEPVRVGDLITRPERVFYVSPAYPAIARAARIEGTVILEATVGADGSVSGVRVLRSIQLLDDAAIEAVRQWRFTPTRLNGEPVPVLLTVTVTFKLQ